MAYTIQKGDTLSGIAKANNTTVEALQAANPQIKDKNVIRAGASLNIPGSTSGSSSGSGNSGSSSGSGSNKSSGGSYSGGSSYSGSSGGSGSSSTGNWNYGGYTAPSFVTSKDDVRALQQQLGVTADGLWGKNTQAAYEKSGMANQYGGSYAGGVPISGQTTYGNGAYGGKYLGSNQSAAYQNMENAPGSTGYEKGTLSGLARRKDEADNIYYVPVSREGVLPLGTSFQATGAALADAQGVPESSGIFAYAKGRTPGYIEHASGYKGYGYQDAKGNFYDANGNYLREDNFYYEPGATISKNGMYQDTGNGMGYAGYGVWGGPGNYIAVKSENYGKAPGTYIETFGGGSGRSYEAPVQQAAPAPTPTVTEPVIQQIVQAAAKKESPEDIERRRNMNAWANSGGMLAW